MSERILHTIPPGNSEKELLLRTASGDEQAFRALFDQYKRLLLTFVYRITQDTGLTEEIVQDIFLKIWMSRETLEQIDNFKSYLFVISRNQALNLIEKEKGKFLKQQAYIKDSRSQVSEDPEAGLPFHLIDQAIDRLPSQQKKAWLLSRHEGLTYEQIASEMEIGRETVKTYIRLANDSIKDFLADQHLYLFLLLLSAGYV